jgi:hypothetical protein
MPKKDTSFAERTRHAEKGHVIRRKDASCRKRTRHSQKGHVMPKKDISLLVPRPVDFERIPARIRRRGQGATTRNSTAISRRYVAGFVQSEVDASPRSCTNSAAIRVRRTLVVDAAIRRQRPPQTDQNLLVAALARRHSCLKTTSRLEPGSVCTGYHSSRRGGPCARPNDIPARRLQRGTRSPLMLENDLSFRRWTPHA